MKLSIRIQLDNIIKDEKFEEEVLNALMKARNITGKQFRVIFWNENLSEKDVKNFVKRNEEILFKMSTQITKKFFYSWFVIGNNGDKSRWRYHCDGDILSGIDFYIRIIKYMSQRDNNESRNRR
jgi:hypothetical protein